jgi:hypothetical protein
MPWAGPDLVSIQVACRDYLGISCDTGYTLARAGRFPGSAAMRIGGQWRVSVPRLLRYLHGDQPAAVAANVSGRSTIPEGSGDHNTGGRARAERAATGARPDITVPAPQPREHAVRCVVCTEPTWRVDALCDRHVGGRR